MTISELQNLFALFVEAADRLQGDKSEVAVAAEALAAAQAKLDKETGDVGGAEAGIREATVALIGGITAFVESELGVALAPAE